MSYNHNLTWRKANKLFIWERSKVDFLKVYLLKFCIKYI